MRGSGSEENRADRSLVSGQHSYLFTTSYGPAPSPRCLFSRSFGCDKRKHGNATLEGVANFRRKDVYRISPQRFLSSQTRRRSYLDDISCQEDFQFFVHGLRRILLDGLFDCLEIRDPRKIKDLPVTGIFDRLRSRTRSHSLSSAECDRKKYMTLSDLRAGAIGSVDLCRTDRWDDPVKKAYIISYQIFQYILVNS